MNKNLLVAVAVTALVFLGFGDCLAKPDVVWTKTFGGPEDEFGVACKTTWDGGYIIAGAMECLDGMCDDIILIKADNLGNQEWLRSYGGDGLEAASSVVSVKDDGGFLIGGSTESYGAGYADIYLIKTDEFGDTLWTRTYGGGGNDWCSSVRPTSDGGFLVSGVCGPGGKADYDVYLLKIDEFGNENWGRLFGGPQDDWAYDARQTADDGYIIVGTTYSYGAGSGDVYLIRLDKSSNLIWEMTFGGVEDDCAYSVAECKDGGFIVTGYTESFGYGSQDLYLVRVDQLGYLAWENWFGGDKEEIGFTVKPTETGGFIIAGCTASFGEGENDVYVVKTDQTGNEKWSLTCGGGGCDGGMALQGSETSGYVIAGTTDSEGAGKHDVYLLKLDAEIPIKLEAIPYQTKVPLCASLDFEVEYMNSSDNLATAKVIFEIFMPGEVDPAWSQSNGYFPFPSGVQKKHYSIEIPLWPPVGDGYRFKASVDVDGYRASESAIDFEITPAMVSVP